jgi:hypothetical protein
MTMKNMQDQVLNQAKQKQRAMRGKQYEEDEDSDDQRINVMNEARRSHGIEQILNKKDKKLLGE